MSETVLPAGLTLEEVKAVARRYFDELTNAQDVDVVDDLFTEDIAFHDPAIVPHGEVHGQAEVRHFFSVFFCAFPDVHFEIDDFLAEGDRVAIRFTWTGTHRHEFLGIELSEKHVAVPGIDIFRIVTDAQGRGRIAEVRVAFDRANLVEQLGGVRRPF